MMKIEEMILSMASNESEEVFGETERLVNDINLRNEQNNYNDVDGCV